MVKINLAAQAALSQARLHELLCYDPLTGIFTYRISRLHGRCAVVAGNVAGKVNPKSGYRYINLDGRAYLAHRLAIFYVKGVWPQDQVDHENGHRDENWLTNLREATDLQNKQNLPPRPSASGLPGARLRWDKKRWISSIKSNGKYIHLGHFATPEEAHAAYVAAKARLHTFNPTVRGLSAAAQTG